MIKKHRNKLVQKTQVRKDKKGRLIIPAEIAELYGIKLEDHITTEKRPAGVYLRMPTRLSKLYIEPTNQCNLNCRTCIRHGWDEEMGMMSDEVFRRIIKGIASFTPRPIVFFGGFGEPLYHPKILDMVNSVKNLGAPVQIITNGTLLTKEFSKELLHAGLDLLWVSLDGANPKSYADIRLGSALPLIIENLEHFREAREAQYTVSDCGVFSTAKTRLGIVFVAMKRNIQDLPEVLKIAKRFSASEFFISNVMPYTKEMRSEILYGHTLQKDSLVHPALRIKVPRIDISETTIQPLYESLKQGQITEGHEERTDNQNGICPFIESGTGSIGWDGGFSPCLPLLHSHMGFLPERERFSKGWTVGNIIETNLVTLWNDPKHTNFRQRVMNFDFPPCKFCGGCELAHTNEEDCWSSGFPTCGGCLWAGGFIQCP